MDKTAPAGTGERLSRAQRRVMTEGLNAHLLDCDTESWLAARQLEKLGFVELGANVHRDVIELRITDKGREALRHDR